ncbi:MAG: M20 family metallopeptidase [Candidatus Methylomirabilia bacterium]
MSVTGDILAQIHSDEVVELTRALVRIPSVFRPGDSEANEARVAAFIASWFKRQGLPVEVQDVAPGRPNVLAWLGGSADGRCLLLEAHTDVVTEGDPQEWTHAPYAADVVDGKVYGRGAADTKGGLAAAMVALAAFKRAGLIPRGKLVVGALVDEEGGMAGVHHLCRTPIGRELDAAIICEPEQNELCLEQRGVAWARIGVRGRMAHGAMPETGINPISAMGNLLREVPALERRLRRGARRSRYLKPPTVTPTTVLAPVEGFLQANVIPSRAELLLDIRLTPGLGEEKLKKQLNAFCRTAEVAQPGVTVEWEALGLRLPTKVDRQEPVVRELADAVREATGKAPRYGGVPGSTDGTVLRTELGIPIVTCGPGNRLIPHQVDEFVEVEELAAAAKIYAIAAQKFLEGHRGG